MPKVGYRRPWIQTLDSAWVDGALYKTMDDVQHDDIQSISFFPSLSFLLASFFEMAAQRDTDKPSKINKNGVPLFKADVTELDKKLDNEIVYEFGGPIGVCAMMAGFPLLMVYFWVCLENQGKLIYPEAFTKEALSDFFWNELWAKFVEGAFPTMKAIKIYMGYVVFSFILAYIMPGPVVEGLPIPSLKGKRVSQK